MRPVVLLDCDGVLADFVGPVLAAFNDAIGNDGEFAEPYRCDQVTEYDIPKALGLTDRGRALFYDLCGALDVGNQPVLEGAIDGVRRLRSIADVVIVTAPWFGHRTWAHERIDWLYRHFEIPYRDVVITSAKHHVRGDLLVDDKTSTLHAWQVAHPGRLAVQWQATWNRGDAWSGASTCDWAQLLDYVRGVA